MLNGPDGLSAGNVAVDVEVTAIVKAHESETQRPLDIGIEHMARSHIVYWNGRSVGWADAEQADHAAQQESELTPANRASRFEGMVGTRIDQPHADNCLNFNSSPRILNIG